MSQVTISNISDGLQRLAHVHLIDAMRTCPAEALDIILDLTRNEWVV